MWLLLVASFFVICFGFVLLFGAPYLPTLSAQQIRALELLNLKKGQTLLELGSGDGRMLRAAARRGIKVVGYELNPILFIISWLLCLPYRRLVKVRFANFWAVNWPKADGIYVFLLDRYMQKLDKKITGQYKGKKIILVSYTFKIPNKTPTKKDGGLSLYEYN